MRQDFLDSSNWYDYYKPISMWQIYNAQDKIGKTLPQSYKTIMLKFNAGTPNISSFYIAEDNSGSSIGAFLSLYGSGRCYMCLPKDTSEFVWAFYNQPEYFQPGLVPFAKTGGEDYICFDYSKDPNTDNPPVVYVDVGYCCNVYFLSNTFDEFLDMLHEDEHVQQLVSENLPK